MSAVSLTGISVSLKRDRTVSQDEVVDIIDKIDRTKEAFFKSQPQSEVCSKKSVIMRYTGIGALIGAGAGAGIGTAVPGIGTGIGVGAGGLVGAGIGAVVGCCKAYKIMEGEYNTWLKNQSEATRKELLAAITRSGKFDFAECSITQDTCWIPVRSLVEPTIIIDRAVLQQYWSMNGMFHPGLLGKSTPVRETDFVIAYDIMIGMNQIISHMLQNVTDLALTPKQREGMEILKKDQDRFLTHCFESEKEALDKLYKAKKSAEGESVSLITWYAISLAQLAKAFGAHEQ